MSPSPPSWRVRQHGAHLAGVHAHDPGHLADVLENNGARNAHAAASMHGPACLPMAIGDTPQTHNRKCGCMCAQRRRSHGCTAPTCNKSLGIRAGGKPVVEATRRGASRAIAGTPQVPPRRHYEPHVRRTRKPADSMHHPCLMSQKCQCGASYTTVWRRAKQGVEARDGCACAHDEYTPRSGTQHVRMRREGGEGFRTTSEVNCADRSIPSRKSLMRRRGISCLLQICAPEPLVWARRVSWNDGRRHRDGTRHSARHLVRIDTAIN